MHPEVRRPGPGPCPICGMALEPVSGAAEDDSELRDMRRRFVVGALFTVPVFLLAMGQHLGLAPLDPGLERWIELTLSTPVVLWCAWPLLVRAWRSVRTLRLNMFTLIGLGVGTAYGYSLLAVWVPDLFPRGFRGPDGEVGVYFEAAAVIVTLVLLGQVLESRAQPDRQRDPRVARPGARDGAPSRACRPRATRWPWRGTGSTTPRPWRGRTWGSPWGPGRTWRWRARPSPS